MLERALEALAADPETAVVCVIGKPPGPVTAKKIRGWLDRLDKPWVTHFTGEADVSTMPTLEDAALGAVALARGAAHRPVEFTRADTDVASLVRDTTAALARGRRHVRGVYAGGTLAHEALVLLGARLGDVSWGASAAGHRVVDLGDDVYTVGRPHPMLDGTIRREWIARDADDLATAVILLDVVLGYGAHDDPAGELAPAIEAARARGVAVVASVCGTERDPQDATRQTEIARRAGAIVMPSNAQAARLAARIGAGAAGKSS
jgi:FdrA protein